MDGPYLEVETVHRALEAMRRGEGLGPASPLAQFASIRQFYRPGAALGGSAGLDSVVFGALAHTIQHRLDHQRRFYGLPLASSQQDVQALKEDFSHNNEELEAWSFLYHRYVRTDLFLSVDQIHDSIQSVAPQSRRNLHRRQSLGLYRLTHHLAWRERRVRLKDQQAFLRSRLPLQSHIAPFMIGRDALTQLAIHYLSDSTSPRHVLIFGAPGIGKTTLAQAVAYRLIDSREIENLAWVDGSGQFRDPLPDRIAGALGLANNIPPLKNYLQMVESLIIVDSAQDLLDRPVDLASALALLGAARLIICAERPPAQMPAGVDLAQVAVPDLDKESAYLLVQHHTRRVEMAQDFKESDVDHLVDELGGNPGVLVAALREGKRFSKTAHSVQIYQAAWDVASDFARKLWILLAIIPEGAKADRMLYRLFSEAETDDLDTAVNDLRLAQVTDRPSTKILMLTPLARSFADHLLRMPEMKTFIEEVLQQVGNYYVANRDAVGCQRFLEKVMKSPLPADLLLGLAGLCAPIMERGGTWIAWSAYLGQLADMVTGPDRRWVVLRLGIALRWLGQWEQAGYWLGVVMGEAGQHGDFIMQADAMTELAVITRARGQLQTAFNLFRRAEATYRRRHAAGLERIGAERIQIALEQRDLPEAARMLDEFEVWSPRLFNLAAQAALRNGEIDLALQYAQSAQKGLVDNLPMWARNTALLGQIYAHSGRWTEAVDHFASALIIMEQTGDLLGYARVRLNLGAIYINLGNTRTALRYLRDLPADLELLGDVESLQIALENLARLPQNAPGKSKRQPR